MYVIDVVIPASNNPHNWPKSVTDAEGLLTAPEWEARMRPMKKKDLLWFKTSFNNNIKDNYCNENK